MTGQNRKSNASLQAQVEHLTRELAEVRAQQAATAEVLEVISRSPTDLQRVLDTITGSMARLWDGTWATIFRVVGDEAVIAAHRREGEVQKTPADHFPLSRDWIAGRAIMEKQTAHVPDLADALDEFPLMATRQRESGFRTVLATPLVRNGGAIGAIHIALPVVRPFSSDQIALLESFADQAVIAIENARLFTELEERNRDLAESLAQQTAIREILEVITSSPTDAQPVLDAVAARAEHLLGNGGVMLSLVDGDELQFRALGPRGLSQLAERNLEHASPIGTGGRLTRQRTAGRAVVDRRTIHVPDVQNYVDPEYPDVFGSILRRNGVQSQLSVPLTQGDRAIGCISVNRLELQPFTDREIALLETFARQAAIAVANANLFQELQQRNRDLAQALEQQTAVSDVLKVISRSAFDIQPVLETLLVSAVKLSGADGGAIHDTNGRAQLTYGFSSEFRALVLANPFIPGRGTLTGRVMQERRVVHIPDVLAEPDYGWTEGQHAGGYRSVLGIPMLRDGAVVGSFSLLRTRVEPFTQRQIELVSTFADQAVIAIENTRLIDELQRRLDEQTATAEVLRVIASAPTDRDRVLDAILTSAARLCGASEGFVRVVEGDLLVTGAFLGPAMHAWAQEARPMPAQPPPSNRNMSAIVMARKKTVRFDTLDSEPELSERHREACRRFGLKSMLAVPLLRRGEPIGSILLARTEERPFSDAEVALVESFANQAVIAIANAELFEQLQSRTSELTKTVEQLTAVLHVGQAVSSTLDLGALLDTIAARAVELSGAEGGGIFELDEPTQRLHLRTSFGQSSELIEFLRRAPLHVGEGVTGRAVATRAPVQVPDATVEGAYQSSVREILLQSGYRALLAVPLLREHQVLGALVVNRSAPGEYAPEVVELLKTFASQSAIALLNARLFQELAEKNDALELAGRHKSQFLANMSHELRTPMNAILGYTELILDGIYGSPPETIRDILGRVETSGRHLLGLINAVLDLSKIEAGRLSLTIADYSLAEVVQTVAASVEPLATEKGLALELSIAPDLPPGRGDERRLSQVLLNLVGNAIKFTEAGAVRVDASAADGQFVVAVADTGPGIAPADQQRIFEEFQQLDASSTREKGGTGLGLAIARRIVELHGGRIWVESEVGKGATFTFAIPVTRDEG